MLAAVRNLVIEANHVAAGRWTRITGNEVCGKTLAIVGFGRIGKEVASRPAAFGSRSSATVTTGRGFRPLARHRARRAARRCPQARDIISLHTKLTPATRPDQRQELPAHQSGRVIVTPARRARRPHGPVAALKSKQLLAYAPTCSIRNRRPPTTRARGAERHSTPHIGSRSTRAFSARPARRDNLTLSSPARNPSPRANEF